MAEAEGVPLEEEQAVAEEGEEDGPITRGEKPSEIDVEEDEEFEGEETGEWTLSEGSAEDEKKAELMREYLELVREIDAQNRIVNELKEKIYDKCQKGVVTKCEEKEIRVLRCCLEKENLKLKCLIKRAMALQAEDPEMEWGSVAIATSFDEDSLPLGFSSKMMESVCKKTFSDDSCLKPDNTDECLQGDKGRGKEISKSDLERFLCCLLRKVKNSETAQRKKHSICGDDDQDDDSAMDIDEETLQKVICALQQQSQDPCGGDTDRKGKTKKKDLQKMCKELAHSYNIQDKLVQDNANLEGDRFKLQEEILNRDRMIECLQKKLQLMQSELQKLMREKKKIIEEECEKGGGKLSPKTERRLKKFKECAKCLQNNIDNLQSSVERMKVEMNSLKRERDQWESQVKNYDDPVCNRKTKADEIEDLKRNYANLLADYCRKENELKEMQKRVKGFSDCYGRQDDTAMQNANDAEIQRLQEKINDLQEEREEFKCLLKEQREQMDDYRKKYMIAQQKVEEQKCIIEKLEMNNKRIEDQINLEIQRIKTKFQEKLKELAQLPKLLENEQIKLASVTKEKEDLEHKLRLVCKELKSIKAQLSTTDGGGNIEELAAKLRQAEHDLAVLQKQYDDMKADKELICEKLQKTQEDLDCLRTESARIIARTKERSESQREILQNRIDKLEKELAQCRATASLSISDREEVIKEMKGQLSTLSYSFDAAQKQIKTLKNHISYLSNENTYPIKC